MKCCKVIATCFANRSANRIKQNSSGTSTSGEVLEMLKDIISLEKSIDAGISVDTILVNNDVGYQAGNAYLDSISNTSTQNGTLRVLHRENRGRSFGAYNDAWQKFKEQYDYWLFLEDQYVSVNDGYYSRGIQFLEKYPNCAFASPYGFGRNSPPHIAEKSAHGGCGFTTSDFLEKLEAFEGSWQEKDGVNTPGVYVQCRAGVLPHYEHNTPEANRSTRLHVCHGEAPFTYAYIKMGYEILQAPYPEDFIFYWQLNGPRGYRELTSNA